MNVSASTAHPTLRLALPPNRQDALVRQLRRMAGRNPTRSQHVDIHYDTPKFALARAGVRLELHREPHGWLQTVTLRQSSATPLHSARRWQTAYGRGFDFSGIDDDEVRELLERPRHHKSLTAISECNFRRQSWPVVDGGATIRAHIDRGWIAASGRRVAISDFTLVLDRGPTGALYGLALKLAEHVVLLPQPCSRAARGALVFADATLAPVKAGAVQFDQTGGAAEAFRHIAHDCLAHLHANHAGAVGTSDPEYIHQMRVASRRLRAAMRMFRPVLPEGLASSLMPAMRDLMSVLGRTRDLDVLIAEIIRPVADALPNEPRLADMLAVVTDSLFTAREDAVAFLSGKEYARLHLLAASLLDTALAAPTTGPAAEAGASGSVADFADERLRKLLKATRRLAAAATAEDPASLHELRIGIKRLRYAIEFFGSALPAKSGPRILRQLADLQDELGQLNDLANAGAILMACAADDRSLREAVTLIGGWHGTRHAALLRALPRHLREAAQLRVPRLGQRPE